MSSLALLARDVGVSERTLRRAVADGALRGSRSSPRKLDLPVDEHQYVRRRWAIISKLRSVLRTEHNVRLALLFGSTAIGTDTADSDVDLLVELRDASFERVVDLKTKLIQELGRQVDLVVLDDARAEPSFLAEALDSGRVIVDRDDLSPTLRADAGRLRRHGQKVDAARIERALAGIDRMLSG